MTCFLFVCRQGKQSLNAIVWTRIGVFCRVDCFLSMVQTKYCRPLSSRRRQKCRLENTLNVSHVSVLVGLFVPSTRLIFVSVEKNHDTLTFDETNHAKYVSNKSFGNKCLILFENLNFVYFQNLNFVHFQKQMQVTELISEVNTTIVNTL